MAVYDMNDDVKRLMAELQENQRLIGELSASALGKAMAGVSPDPRQLADRMEELNRRTAEIQQELAKHRIG